MLATSDGLEFYSQRVTERNRPHGSDPEVHIWWQELAVLCCLTVLVFFTILAVLFHARRPRATTAFLRGLDHPAITGSQSRQAHGGLIVVVYVIMSLCVLCIRIAHQVTMNTKLDQLSLPRQEASSRTQNIKADFTVSATIYGYTGPCVASDSVETAGADDRDEGRRLQEEPAGWWGGSRSQVRTKAAVQEHSILPGGVYRTADPTVHQQAEWAVGDERDGFEEDLDSRRLAPGTACHSAVHGWAIGLVPKSNESSASSAPVCVRTAVDQCSLFWTCQDCSPSHKWHTQFVVSVSGGKLTAAREIEWTVRDTWKSVPQEERDQEWKFFGWATASRAADRASDFMFGKDHTAFSSMKATVNAGHSDHCLRGPDASRVHVTLVPTDYKDRIRNTEHSGFVAQFDEANAGSTASPSSFHEAEGVVRSELSIATSSTCYKLVLSTHRSIFDFLAQMLGFCAGMSLIARLTNHTWKDLSLRTRHTVNACWSHKNPMVRCFSCMLFFWVEEEPPEEEDENGLPWEDPPARDTSAARHSHSM